LAYVPLASIVLKLEHDHARRALPRRRTVLVLASQHLANLERLEPDLAHHAADLVGEPVRPQDPSDAP
jgi:hypothetical protein